MNQSGGYSPKDLHFADKAQKKLLNGITKMANAVKSTLGPMGQTVLIESPEHTNGLTVTKDGVTVSRSINLLDPVENLAVQMMRQAANNTASSAGDGTTTAIVLAEALSYYGFSHIGDDQNRTEVLREMSNISNDIIKILKKQSQPVTNKRLLDVATISANNDKEVGKIISDTYKSVGNNGVVTVEKSQSSETTFETTNGIKVDRGLGSPLFINDHKKDECVLEDCYILVSDSDINNILDIETVLRPIIAEKKKLLIIAPCSTNVVNTLAANVQKNDLQLCQIVPPQFGWKKEELLNDIALSVGANYFSASTGDDLSIIEMSDLGKASKVIIGRDSTLIIRDSDHVNDSDINDRISQLKDSHKIAKTKEDGEFILSRIASLAGGIGTISVGGQTDLEQKELYDRVDDAVCAVRSALEQGILPGGGVALANAALALDPNKYNSDSQKTALNILREALVTPIKQIHENAGRDLNFEEFKDLHSGHGQNIKTGQFGDMIKMGVIDPMKVTSSALQNAVSVATTILSTNAIVTMARTFEAK